MIEELQREVAELRRELAELRAMVANLAPSKPAPASATSSTPAPTPKKAEGIDEETMMVISAAVAAFLGKRATIKLVRPIHQQVDGWRLQGRVAVQGSHRVR